MIDKNKMKKFLASSYKDSIKVFVINSLEKIYDPSYTKYLIYFIYLDLFNSLSIHTENLDSYYIIDFGYLNSLSEPVLEQYLKMLNRQIFSFDVHSIYCLCDSGILISNIEHLKVKRESKLNRLKDVNEYDDDFLELFK